MKLKDAISLSEQVVPATQSADVKGVPKIVGPIVRRQVPAGYIADVRKRKKKKVVKEQHEAGLAPPTQLAPYRDLEYQRKHWAGTRPEYKPKKSWIINPKKKQKKKKDSEEDIKSGLQIEQFAGSRTRDVPPNYLMRSLSPFFASKESDNMKYKAKKDYFNKPPQQPPTMIKKKKKKILEKPDETI